MYLMDFTELHNNNNMSIEFFVQQGWIWYHQSIVNANVCVVDIIVNDYPSLLVFPRRYIGYPSTFVIVSLVKFLRKPLLHVQGDKQFRSPVHGIMFVVTISNSSWSVDGSGISAEITLSIFSVRMLSTNEIKIYAWGNPRFFLLTKYYLATCGPNTCNFVMKLIKYLNFCLSTRAVMSWWCIAFWRGNTANLDYL